MRQSMQISAERERLVHAAHRLARVARGDPLKLFRLLYKLDVQHFRDLGRSCTGETYYALADGPAPGTLRGLLTLHDLDLDTAIGRLTATRSQGSWSFDARPFSAFDLALLNELETAYRDVPSCQLTLDDAHAWWRVYNSQGGVGAMIPYEMTVSRSVLGPALEQTPGRLKFVDRLRAGEPTSRDPLTRSKPKGLPG